MKRSRSRRGRAKEYSFGALALALLLFFLYEVYPALTQPGGSAAPPPLYEAGRFLPQGQTGSGPSQSGGRGRIARGNGFLAEYVALCEH